MSDTHGLSQSTASVIDVWIKKFPEGKARSAVLAGLKAAQDENGGHLTNEIMENIAAYIGLPAIEVFEVASFYDMCEFKPIGRYKLSVCTNVSCMLCGSHAIVDHLEKRLGVKMGETTQDGMFTLRDVECLAACINAPMLQVNDRELYEKLTPESVDVLLDRLIAEAKSGE